MKYLPIISQPKFVFLDNNFILQDQALISPNQRGFLYGDGLFESCKIIEHKIINFEAHLNRLQNGANYLKIPAPSKKILTEICLELIARNYENSGLIRIYLSRGEGSIGYLPKSDCKTLLFIETKKLLPFPQNHKLIVCDYNPPQFHFKTANSIPYILAKNYAHENGYYDSIMLDKKQIICETSSANIFWIKDKKIFTPSDSCDIIYGTIRESLLAIKELNITQVEYNITKLLEADEVFITNANLVLMPIEKIAFRNTKNIYEIEFKKIVVKNILKLLKIALQLK